MGKLTVEQALLRAKAHEKKGEIAQAHALLAEMQAAYPGNARVRQALAGLAAAAAPPRDQMAALLALYQRGQLAAAADRARTLVRQYPLSAPLWNLLGAACAQTGQPAAAVEAFRRAAQINPAHPDVFYNLGKALIAQDLPEDAATAFARAVEIRPDHADAHSNLGNALQKMKQPDQAIAAYGRALALRPDHADAHSNLGNALMEQGRLDDAIAAFNQALRYRPDHADAHSNLGFTLQQQGRLDEAAASLERAIHLAPDHAEALTNLGNVRMVQGRTAAAVEAYQRALRAHPDHAPAHFHMGHLLADQGQRELAITAYRRALELNADDAAAEASLLHQMAHLCDWSEAPRLAEAGARLGITGGPAAPFGLLAALDDPACQLARAQAYARDKYRLPPPPLPARPATRPDRLRIGYFGADFRDHATMYLMAGLLREHDRSAVETIIYSYGQTRTGAMRDQARASVDAFHDVADWPDRQIVDLARSHALDVAVDLKGYTQDTRSGLFQHRLAPVQVNWLGYPGTMGADFIDYILADPVVIPDTERAHISEHVIRLPHSYQPNDDRRPIAGTGGSRADHGLPDGAFVFCCFNNTWKLGPAEFDIWMHLLAEVPGSVLWLFRSNAAAEVNLRAEAARRGIDPARLVLADRLPHAEHLARLRHADLFLDTFNYNAHTTASDALWAGVPLVTKQGRSFAARVASSLLTAVDLPELITHDDDGYQALALALARDPQRLAGLRSRLAANRTTAPLFETRRFARAFESGLRQAWERWFTGLAPTDIDVADG